MEQVTPELKQFMAEQSQGITPDLARQTRYTGGLLVMDVGPRGGGKTTKGVDVVQIYREAEPEVRRISNVPIEDAYYVPNILKFLATKLIAEGGEKPYEIRPDGTVKIVPRKMIPAKMLVIVDETAISGLEARGSGLFSLNTYLLALSRKLNVDVELISQLMSMADKRAQWLSDYYTLCEAFRELGFFRYRTYDSEFRKTNTRRLWFSDAEEYLFPKFDTTDIPNYDELSTAYQSFYRIYDDDMKLYEDIKAGRKHISAEDAAPKQPDVQFISRKSLRAPLGRYPGETLFMGGKRLEILQKDFDIDKGQYRYRAREIPDILSQQESMDEAGVEPIGPEEEPQ